MSAGISDPSARNNTPSRKSAQQAVRRAFLAARLITRSVPLAEAAGLDAIEQWDPEEEPEERLLRLAVANAVKSRNASPESSDDCHLPPALAALAEMTRPLRECFVVRFIGGWSRQFCAEMLLMNRRRVQIHTRAALEQLAAAERN